MTTQQAFRNTLVVVFTLIGVYVIYLSSRILIVLLIAIIVASAVRPAVLRFQKFRIPQTLAMLIVYALLGIFIFGLAAMVVPPVTSQLGEYVNNDSGVAYRIISAQSWLEQSLTSMTGNPVKLFNPEDITKTVSSTINELTAALPSLAGEFGNLLADAVLVLVMGAYWLTSRDHGVDFLLQLFPLGWRAEIEAIISEIEASMSAYIRGVVLVAAFVGLANFVILSLLRVPNAATLAFIMGATTMLPIIGGYIGAFTATLLALLSSPVNALFAFGSFVAVQQVENHYLTPRVMSESVGLNPILIIVFLFVGSALGGVVGALIAVPVAGSLAIIIRHLVIEPRKNETVPHIVDGGILLTSTGNGKPEKAQQ